MGRITHSAAPPPEPSKGEHFFPWTCKRTSGSSEKGLHWNRKNVDSYFNFHVKRAEPRSFEDFLCGFSIFPFYDREKKPRQGIKNVFSFQHRELILSLMPVCSYIYVILQHCMRATLAEGIMHQTLDLKVPFRRGIFLNKYCPSFLILFLFLFFFQRKINMVEIFYLEHSTLIC